jgi:hypothetical protein
MKDINPSLQLALGAISTRVMAVMNPIDADAEVARDIYRGELLQIRLMAEKALSDARAALEKEGGDAE